MSARRRRRNRLHYRRRRQNWWPWLVFVIVTALFFWAVFQFFLVLFSNVRSEAISVELNVEQGRAEFLLPDNANWNPAFSEQKFLEGDSIRTAKNSRVVLSFLTDSRIWLDSETELKIVELTQKSSGKTQAVLNLVSGQAWAEINDAVFSGDAGSALVLGTDRSKTYVQGTTFNLKTDNQADTITLMEGQVSVDVIGEKDNTKNVQVGVGQVLTVDEGTYDLINRGVTPLEAIAQEFEESNWYLDNLERKQPEVVAATRLRLNPPPPEVPETEEEVTASEFFDSLEIDEDIEAPTITKPVEGEQISADVDLIPIEGTAPLEAFQIQVNDYVLQRFEPGDRKWTYIAATEYGTLKPGDNRYDVVAITRDGKRSPIVSVNIFYEGTAAPAPATASTSTPTATSNNTSNLTPPVVTRPALFSADPNATYETSASVVTFAGTVDPGTQAVEVNGFRLRKFSAGDTEFSYIANATYGNMREGENVYTIKAFDIDGNTVESQIKIFYRAVNLE